MDGSHNHEETGLGIVALLLGVLAIGMAPILVRFGDADPSAIAFWRIALTLPIMYLIAWRKETIVTTKPTRTDYFWLISTGVAFAANLALWHLSINLTKIANATLFDNCAPIFVCLITWLFFKQKLGAIIWLGLLLSIVGGVMLTLPHLEFSPQYLQGDMLALLAGFFYAIYIISVQKARRVFGVMHLMAHSGVVSCVTLAITMIFTGESFTIQSQSGLMAILALAFIVHLSGQGLITYALRFVPATLSSITLLGQAIIGTVAAWIIFKEVLTPIQIVGGIIILIGIALAQASKRIKSGRSKEPAEPYTA